MSSNDWNSSQSPQGTDGWAQPDEGRKPRPADFAEQRPPELDLRGNPSSPLERTKRAQQPPRTRAEVAESGQPMAILAHLSLLFGLPVFLIPMVRRKNAFALHHAKAAGVIYGIFLLCGIFALLTCGLAVPLVLLCYVPGLVGIVKAATCEDPGPWAFGNLGEKVFSGLEVKQDTD